MLVDSCKSNNVDGVLTSMSLPNRDLLRSMTWGVKEMMEGRGQCSPCRSMVGATRSSVLRVWALSANANACLSTSNGSERGRLSARECKQIVAVTYLRDSAMTWHAIGYSLRLCKRAQYVGGVRAWVGKDDLQW